MKSFLVALAFVAMGISSNAQITEQKNSPTPESPKVEIVSQPESPLQILSVQTKSLGNVSLIEVSITVENRSPKPISAYATRDPSDDSDSCFVLSANSPGKALRQGQSELRTTWRGNNPTSQMRRLVDFVEFTDGTTWGTDICQTAEYLTSRRAGAREARKLLLEIFEAGGADAVLSRLKAGITPVDPPANHSPKWKPGFRSGFESFVERIKQANQEWGYTEIEYALRRPIDALTEKEF